MNASTKCNPSLCRGTSARGKRPTVGQKTLAARPCRWRKPVEIHVPLVNYLRSFFSGGQGPQGRSCISAL